MIASDHVSLLFWKHLQYPALASYREVSGGPVCPYALSIVITLTLTLLWSPSINYPAPVSLLQNLSFLTSKSEGYGVHPKCLNTLSQ